MTKKAKKKVVKKSASATSKKKTKKPTAKQRATAATRRAKDLHQKKFLDHYKVSGNIQKSAEYAGCNRATIYNWKKTEAFLARFTEAQDIYIGTLEAEADRRAVEGVKEPVYQGGELVGYKQKYSDTLLMFRLNGLKPEVYKRQQVEHTGKDGKPIEHKHSAGISDKFAEQFRKKVLGVEDGD